MRKSRGFGTFITREQIEKKNPRVTTDLFRSVSGVKLLRENGTPTVVSTRLGTMSYCPVRYYIDGTSYPLYGQSIDTMVQVVGHRRDRGLPRRRDRAAAVRWSRERLRRHCDLDAAGRQEAEVALAPRRGRCALGCPDSSISALGPCRAKWRVPIDSPRRITPEIADDSSFGCSPRACARSSCSRLPPDSLPRRACRRAPSCWSTGSVRRRTCSRTSMRCPTPRSRSRRRPACGTSRSRSSTSSGRTRRSRRSRCAG